jgi:branched-chain amino acid transport system permease protein
VAILLSMVAGFLIGAVVEGAVVRRVEGHSHLTIIIVTFGLFIGFNSLAGIIWGTW